MTQHTAHDRRSVPLLAIGVALIALSACGKAAPKDPKTMSGAELAQELERCKGLGLKASDDEACKAAQKERFARFIGESKEPPK